MRKFNMSSAQIKTLLESIDSLEEGSASSINQVTSMIDDLEAGLSDVIYTAKSLERLAKQHPDLFDGPFAGQLRAYLIPHLEAWIQDENQPGSLATLKNMINISDEEL